MSSEELKEVCKHLVEVIEKLDGGSGQSTSSVPSARANSSSSSRSSVSRGAGGSPSSSRPSRHSEISRLFNFTPSLAGAGGKGAKRRAIGNSGSTKRKPKIPTWTHSFVCLSKRDQTFVPDYCERAQLKLAGLGEKRCTISADASPAELYEHLLQQFPKLRNSGGYEMMRQGSCGKELEIIPTPQAGYSVEYLKSIISNAKIFIRPIQADLEEVPCEAPDGKPWEEVCLRCGNRVPISSLKQHMVDCTLAARPDLLDSARRRKHSVDRESTDDEEDADDGCSHRTSYVKQSDDEADDDPLLDYVLSLSCRDSKQKPDAEVSLNDIVSDLQKQLSGAPMQITVRRSDFMDDVLRKCTRSFFDPAKRIEVEFVGEQGIDVGGLRREFFHLLQLNVYPRFINECGNFTNDAAAIEDRSYFFIGQLASMSLVNGGSGFNVLSLVAYKYICGDDPCTMAIVVTKDISDLMESKEAVDQFIDGLSCLGTLAMIRKHPMVLQQFFLQSKRTTLTTDSLRKIFKEIRFSDEGSNERRKEEATYMQFTDYLHDIEEGRNSQEVTLSMVLNFFSGSSVIPASGFSEAPAISFSPTNPYPTSCTCAIELTLPTKFSDNYLKFKESCNVGFTCHGGFGLP